MGEARSGSKSCLHNSCRCTADENGSYCSDACRSAHLSGGMGGTCHCGHEACQNTADQD